MHVPALFEHYLPKSVHPWILYALAKMAKYLLVPVLGGTGWLARRWQLSRTRYWPSTHGHIEAHSPGGDACLCLLSYSYTLEGEYYSGEMPVHKGKLLKNFDDVVEKLPVGTPIEVRYRQNAPNISVGVLTPIHVLDGFAQ
jgi:hypothetical protein